MNHVSMKLVAVAFVVLGAFAACGGKGTGAATPAVQPSGDGTGGNRYGAPAPSGDITPADPSAEGFVDPCAPTE
jgi:hypothetical protein